MLILVVSRTLPSAMALQRRDEVSNNFFLRTRHGQLNHTFNQFDTFSVSDATQEAAQEFCANKEMATKIEI